MKAREKREQPLTTDEESAFNLRVSQVIAENNRLGHENAWMRDKLRSQADEIATLRAEVAHLAQFKPAAPVEIAAQQELAL